MEFPTQAHVLHLGPGSAGTLGKGLDHGGRVHVPARATVDDQDLLHMAGFLVVLLSCAGKYRRDHD